MERLLEAGTRDLAWVEGVTLAGPRQGRISSWAPGGMMLAKEAVALPTLGVGGSRLSWGGGGSQGTASLFWLRGAGGGQQEW